MRYWIGVASKEHVIGGVSGGYCQLNHGKAQPLNRMSVGDWIIYYSPKEEFNGTEPCQQFTAIGEIVGAEAYSFEMFPGFAPYRKDVRFLEARNTSIRPILNSLSFIKDKSKWGSAFRFGHLEILRSDFELIAINMLGLVPLEFSSQAG